MIYYKFLDIHSKMYYIMYLYICIRAGFIKEKYILVQIFSDVIIIIYLKVCTKSWTHRPQIFRDLCKWDHPIATLVILPWIPISENKTINSSSMQTSKFFAAYRRADFNLSSLIYLSKYSPSKEFQKRILLFLFFQCFDDRIG